jgi:hypothetical protein
LLEIATTCATPVKVYVIAPAALQRAPATVRPTKGVRITSVSGIMGPRKKSKAKPAQSVAGIVAQ